MSTINELLGFKTPWKVTPMGTKRIWEVSEMLREEDKQEILHTSDRDSFEMCVFDLIIKYPCPVYELSYKGTTVGMGGLSKAFRSDKTVIWLCFTPEYKKHKLSFLKFSKQFLGRLVKAYGTLTNVVWLPNKTHVEYLNWLGATWTPLSKDFAIFELGGESK